MKKSKTAGRRRVSFLVKANPGSEVYLAGSFNNWDPKTKRMKESKTEGEYTVKLMLAPGEHQYKFIINGEWHVDPECSNWVRNDHGTLNSLIRV